MIATSALAVWLALPPVVAAKSLFELRIAGHVTIQGELDPGLFAGRPCVEVVPHSRGDGAERTNAGVAEIEAGRSYGGIVAFSDGGRASDAVEARLVLRELETGRVIDVGPEEDFGGRGRSVYFDVEMRFPRPGLWSVAVVDGAGARFELSEGKVVRNAGIPPNVIAEAERESDLPAPSACPQTPPRAAAASGTPSGPLIGISAGLAALVAGMILLRHRRA